MINIQSFAIPNREEAGLLLAEKLRRFADSRTMVVGVSHGGALIGYHLASALNLAFDVIPCRKINHPSNSNKSIGSISVNEIIVHEDAHDIPREYVYHQIAMNQNIVKAQRAIYKTDAAQSSLNNKTVIIVGDLLTNADAVLASVISIKKQKPEQIIIAVPGATPEVVRRLLREANDVIALTVETNLRVENFFEANSIIKDEEVRDLILKAMQRFAVTN